MSPTEPTETNRQLRADARRNRQRILDAAVEVFSERGVDAQIDDVARQAELGVGTIYRHFPTKEALVAELVRQKFLTFAENAREALDADGEPFEAFAALLRRNAEFCSRDAAVQHALSASGEPLWTHAQPEIDELVALTDQLVSRAQAAGTMRSDVSARDIPMLMCGVSSTMAHDFPGFDWHRHLELVIDMLRASGHTD
jgi:AcrR family transcriptional regulator